MHSLRSLNLRILTAFAALPLAVLAPASAHADGGHGSSGHEMSGMHQSGPSMPGTSHGGHAMPGMSHGGSGYTMPGMSHGGHATHGGDSAIAAGHGTHRGHSSTAPSPTPEQDDHAAHSASGHEESSAGGDSHEGGSSSGHGDSHGGEAAAKDRPVGLVLAGFAGFNALVLFAALLLRRRPGAVKRRETLARVRRAAGVGEPDPTGEAVS